MNDWRKQMVDYIQRLEATKPPMPIPAQVGFFLGTGLGTVANLLKSIPGVEDLMDGYSLGLANVKADIARRQILKLATQEAEKAILAAAVPPAGPTA